MMVRTVPVRDGQELLQEEGHELRQNVRLGILLRNTRLC